MTLEDEKKLVAEFMNYIIIDRLHIKYGDGPYKGQYFKDGSPWEPWEDRNVWPEIFDIISKEHLWGKFLLNLLPILFPLADNKKVNVTREMLMKACLTAPASVCWKALIKTLGEA